MSTRPIPALFIDAQAVQGRRGDGGTARYITEHLMALRGAGVTLAAIALNPDAPPPSGRNEALLQMPELGWNTRQSFRRALRRGPTAFHMASPFSSTPSPDSLLPRYVREARVPVVATVYDLTPARFPERYFRSPAAYRSYNSRLRLLASADVVLATSEATKQDAIRLLEVHPDRVHNIGGGVTPFFRPPSPDDDIRRTLVSAFPALHQPFVLTAVSSERRADLRSLLAAWARLPEDLRRVYQLVVVGGLADAGRQQWLTVARGNGLRDGEVFLTGVVTNEIRRALYQATTLFVSPAESEGYGLAVAEAVVCGAPAISSRRSSFPEIVNWRASTFDHADPSEIAGLMTQSLTDEDFRAELSAASARAAPHHTWERVAERTVSALTSLQADFPPPSRPADAPCSTALVGPLAPSLSGIASYNSMVLTELEAACHVDAFVDEQPTKAPQIGPDRYPASALGRSRSTGDYDTIVYTIGNSDFHHAALQLVRETPGIVWLHDVHLTGLYFTLTRRSRDPKGAMEDVLRRSYGHRVPSLFYEGELFDDDLYRSAGFRLTAEIGRLTTGIIVNSHLAARLLRLDAGPSVALPPITVIPLAFPSVSELRRRERSTPLLVHLGWLGPTKQPELLLEAFALLTAKRPAEMAFVGPCEEGHADALEARAAALGISSAVTITREVDRPTYESWIDEATLAVQLRSVSNGESSATVCEAMAAGLPVVSNIATLYEQPRGTVHLLDQSIGPAALATSLGVLLDDGGRRYELARRAHEHAATWTYRNVAEAVLAFAARLDPQPRPPSS